MDKQKNIEIKQNLSAELFGPFDENIKLIEEILRTKITVTSDSINIRGNDEACVSVTAELLDKLTTLAQGGQAIDKMKVRQSLELILSGKGEEILTLAKDAVAVTSRGKQIKCKTLGQREYVKSIKNNTVVFGVGPAGTGKTYLAVALAAAAYRRGEVEKIILTRPAIEAGEKLGFLPGDMQMKVDPYLRPLFDALNEMFGVDNYLKLLERSIIEIAPLAYMRGRTLSNAFIILDEAQNTTTEQMKMFLTRLGEGSRMIINGDVTQIDLPYSVKSGLSNAVEVLKDVDGIGICFLSEKDIVRHELVQRIVLAYSKVNK